MDDVSVAMAVQELERAAVRLSCYMNNHDPDIPYSLASAIYEVEAARIRLIEAQQRAHCADGEPQPAADK